MTTLIRAAALFAAAEGKCSWMPWLTPHMRSQLSGSTDCEKHVTAETCRNEYVGVGGLPECVCTWTDAGSEAGPGAGYKKPESAAAAGPVAAGPAVTITTPGGRALLSAVPVSEVNPATVWGLKELLAKTDKKWDPALVSLLDGERQLVDSEELLQMCNSGPQVGNSSLANSSEPLQLLAVLSDWRIGAQEQIQKAQDHVKHLSGGFGGMPASSGELCRILERKIRGLTALIHTLQYALHHEDKDAFKRNSDLLDAMKSDRLLQCFFNRITYRAYY